ncbi:WD40 repeat-like protein [Pleomassaria siparia CBS 279.74]|uniref:ASTRA-associated protein 1 n=1 Tax=Pleomassaria siparia CBS 279.74 TaxID=1314801 RepID=A0A6G1JSK2_9PLEO|nr:WD40 repeat-like protein [Pleomassaria siparia CBS 279.74]
MATLPPAQPSYIFRGHTSQIHSVRIIRQNSRLLTGDADGWVVCWKLESKRPLAFGAMDEATYSTLLPADGADGADGASAHRPKPWLLHSLPVNTLNFCPFSMCYDMSASNDIHTTIGHSILVAVPSTDDKKIDVYQFPDQKLVSIIPRVQSTDTGMVMAVKLAHHPQSSKSVIVIAGYEGGFTAVHLLNRTSHTTGKAIPDFASLIYLSQPHTQPILSLDTSPDANMYYTSSADAIIAAHCVPALPLDISPNEAVFPTREEEQDVNDSTPSSAKSHPVVGASHSSSITVTSTSQDVTPTFSKQPVPLPSSSTARPAGISSLLSSAPAHPRVKPLPPPVFTTSIQPPCKTSQTKHAGQQSLCVRSDGRLLVTGGWDSRVRIYSAKTLKQVAVLKWHKEGVYAVHFGDVLNYRGDGIEERGDAVSREKCALSGMSKLQQQREEQIKAKHWVAAGSKDGKVSLWEVF